MVLHPEPDACVAFKTPEAFRRWLVRHHQSCDELFVRCFKVHAADQGITYAQALDEVLCFGWIDGVRHSLDEDSFSVRVTPRQARSRWSRVNVAHVTRLIRDGRMAKAGLEAFERRDPDKAAGYSFEHAKGLDAALLRRFRAATRAWAYFETQTPSYRKLTSHWVMEAARVETRERRFQQLLACSERGEPIPQLDRRPPTRQVRPGAVRRGGRS